MDTISSLYFNLTLATCHCLRDELSYRKCCCKATHFTFTLSSLHWTLWAHNLLPVLMEIGYFSCNLQLQSYRYHCNIPTHNNYNIKTFNFSFKPAQTKMWADAQRDGRPAKYRWRPLFNAAKCGPILDCRALRLPRRETGWNCRGAANSTDLSR